MKIRIKFSKTGALKFVGHLDLLRFFQKAFRRSDVDIAYSSGFSPHQILSFAAPLGIGTTSSGEYLDAEFNSTLSSKEMIQKINDVLVPDLQISEFVVLPDKAKKAMAAVAAADYVIYFREGYYDETQFLNAVNEFAALTELKIVKKTKKSEKEVDIRPFIYQIGVKNGHIAMRLCTGSNDNLKPELVMECMCQYLQLPYQELAFMVHREETLMWVDEGEQAHLEPLSYVGQEIM